MLLQRIHYCMPRFIRSLMRSFTPSLGVVILMAAAVQAAEDGQPIAVIVSAQPGLAPSIDADELGLIFWRKKLYAAHGLALHPVNLHSEHPLRLMFSQWVLHSAPRSQINYWNGLYFHGVQPPYTVQSEEAMIRYVAETDGAVGYIDACHVDDRVKAVFWLTAGKVSADAPTLRCDSN